MLSSGIVNCKESVVWIEVSYQLFSIVGVRNFP